MTVKVLHLGEVAGVASSLCHVLNESDEWNAIHSPLLPNVTPGQALKTQRLGIISKALKVRRRAAEEIERVEPELIHIHWARLKPFIGRAHRPVVVHAHGSDVRDSSGVFSKVVTRSMSRADCRLVSTPDLLPHMPTDSLWLPNPVDTEFFSPRGNKPEPRTLFIFARFMEVKGARELLTACEIVQQQLPSVKIVGIAGGEFDRQAEGLGVKMLPFMDGAAIRASLEQASLVVGQQKLGILSLSELETMAMERPLLTKVDPTLYSDRFQYLTKYSAAELPELIIEHFSDPSFLSAGVDKLRQEVVELHSHNSVLNQLLAIYKQLI